MTALGYIFLAVGVGVPLLIAVVYISARIAGLGWYRSRAEYDRGFINRKGRNGNAKG